MQTAQDIYQRLSRSVTAKVIIIGIMILVLLIPSFMVQGLIEERQRNRDEVVQEVSDKWGRSQTVAGPILSIPYFQYRQVNGEIIKDNRTLFVLPDKLDVEGQITPEIRQRNIYKVIVYNSAVAMGAVFDMPDINQFDIPLDQVKWDKATILFGLSDLRGIQEEINVQFDGNEYPAESGLKYHGFSNSGFTSLVNLNPEKKQFNFSLNLKLSGSKSIFFTPVGKTTKVTLKSPWSTPSFDGNFLPDNHQVNDDGFEASWTVLDLNRNYPQIWDNQTRFIEDSAFGVKLLFPVDEYQKSMRSAKYAIMFIALTFLVFLFVEIINKKRIHPVQYLLVSVALLVFYTLLLSLSEQIGFNLAYIISAVAIISMITIYTFSIFKSTRLMFGTAGFLTILYGFMYSILQMEDYALLFGSIGLFIILSAIMYLSRKINWYGQISSS